MRVDFVDLSLDFRLVIRQGTTRGSGCFAGIQPLGSSALDWQSQVQDFVRPLIRQLEIGLAPARVQGNFGFVVSNLRLASGVRRRLASLPGLRIDNESVLSACPLTDLWSRRRNPIQAIRQDDCFLRALQQRGLIGGQGGPLDLVSSDGGVRAQVKVTFSPPGLGDGCRTPARAAAALFLDYWFARFPPGRGFGQQR
ncbi:hypothetical protein SAMN05660916_02352 [Arthrobacter sp. 31Cvi3.1E]|nr:hypothetical protein SAMN05660916_02352 [Arthrobacter sp. 31Cvi3.1E]